MKQKSGVYAFISLIAGLAIGGATGWFVQKPALDAQTALANELQLKLETSESAFADGLKSAGEENAKLTTELNRLKADLVRAKADHARAANDLVRVSSELNLLKTPPAEPAANTTAAPAPTESQPETPQTRFVQVRNPVTGQIETRTVPVPTPVASVPSSGPALAPTEAVKPAGTTEYVIKDGDSLWKIAASQLGDGSRFKEIIAANPPMTEQTKLMVGAKLNIPAK